MIAAKTTSFPAADALADRGDLKRKQRIAVSNPAKTAGLRSNRAFTPRWNQLITDRHPTERFFGHFLRPVK
ncbi:MAG: hypothetical protein WA733_03400 [Methylocystis sp.]